MSRNTLDSIIGRTITEIRVMSFFISRKLICDTIALYIKTDTGLWYKLFTSDGFNFIESQQAGPIEITLDEIDDDFAYPVNKINILYSKGKIESINKYMYKNYPDELNGFYIKLDKGAGFSLFEKEGCLKIIEGIIIDKDYSLVEYY